jgi:pimeloyl-ACP methyl ester carboxylesterase
MPTIPPPPGELVDVGGYRLHLQRQGRGSPPVVLEAALGDCSLSWALVQPKVASFTTVYSYDRAGLAWSDTGPYPRTAGAMVAELHDLLRTAAVELPVVLAAHSFGGLVARLHAHLHPDDVAGLVLVDAAHEDQDRNAPAALQPLLAMSHTADELRQMPLSVPPGLPPDVTATYQALITANHAVEGFVAETMALEDSRAELRDAGITTLGAIPLIAVRHGVPLSFPPEMGIPPEAQKEYEATWQRHQSGFAALSSAGQVRVAHNAGHMIPHEAPDVVVAAIRDVVEKVRGHGSAARRPRRPSARHAGRG